MSKKDQITGRGPATGNKRSHAMNHSRRTWNLNLQTIRVELPDGGSKKVKVSTKTIKTLKKYDQPVDKK